MGCCCYEQVDDDQLLICGVCVVFRVMEQIVDYVVFDFGNYFVKGRNLIEIVLFECCGVEVEGVVVVEFKYQVCELFDELGDGNDVVFVGSVNDEWLIRWFGYWDWGLVVVLGCI